jgi:hypothetical protein
MPAISFITHENGPMINDRSLSVARYSSRRRLVCGISQLRQAPHARGPNPARER